MRTPAIDIALDAALITDPQGHFVIFHIIGGYGGAILAAIWLITLLAKRLKFILGATPKERVFNEVAYASALFFLGLDAGFAGSAGVAWGWHYLVIGCQTALAVYGIPLLAYRFFSRGGLLLMKASILRQIDAWRILFSERRPDHPPWC